MPYWGGGTWGARALRANELMYFALMRHARQRGCTAFDFGRSKLGTGAFAYKKNWGFKPQSLGYAVRTADGAAPREVNPLSPRYRLQVAVFDSQGNSARSGGSSADGHYCRGHPATPGAGTSA